MCPPATDSFTIWACKLEALGTLLQMPELHVPSGLKWEQEMLCTTASSRTVILSYIIITTPQKPVGLQVFSWPPFFA